MYITLFFILELLVIFYLLKNASNYSLVDIPNDRSSHDTPKPRGAGIAIFISFLLYFMILKNDFFIQNIFFFISISFVFAIGIFDDIKNISPKTKFLVIWLAIVILFFMTDLKLLTLGEWFGFDLKLPTILALFINLFIISGFTNALNLIDGLDGLAGSVSLVIFSAFLYLGLRFDDSFVIYISSTLIVFIVGFLIFNWYPSKIFMGDSGSLLLGFIISIVAIKLTNHISVTSVLFLTAIPIIDTIVIMIRRIKAGKSPFSPDKTHIHHILFNKFQSVPKTVLFISFIQLLFSAVGVVLSNHDNLLITILFLVTIYLTFKYVK
jgi:UDP-GlcNAc:undecaprenyl-phosphate GlcNAc-1-phosphate transferase